MTKKFNIEQFKGGCIKSPKDLRDILVTAIQPIKAVPETYKDEKMVNQLLKFVHNQGSQPSCVACSGSKVQVAQEYKEGIDEDFSVRFLYSLAKKLDGYEGDGTYLRIMAKILVEIGACLEKDYPTDYSLSKETFKDWVQIPLSVFEKAIPFRDKAYANYVPHPDYKDDSFQRLKQMIYENGIVMAGFYGDNEGWKNAYIRPPKVISWGHAVPLIYYDKNYIYFLNSWGDNWGNKGIGYFDKNYLPFETWTFIDKINFNYLTTMRLVKGNIKPEIYLIEGGVKHKIPNPQTLAIFRSKVETINQIEIDALTEGEPIPDKNDKLRLQDVREWHKQGENILYREY